MLTTIIFYMLRPINYVVGWAWAWAAAHENLPLARALYLLSRFTDPWKGADPRDSVSR